MSRGRVLATLAVLVGGAAVVTWRARQLPTEEIVFASGGERLTGTLIKPKGNGPFPAVVFTHYSGTQTREAGNYRRRAVRFARGGIAAFIYDRRGRGASTGDPHRIIPFELLAADAVAAVQTLRLRADIVPGAIGVSGHSQGGWVAPLAASLSGDVAFVVVSSPAGSTPYAQDLYAMGHRLRASGMDSVTRRDPAERIRSFDPAEADRNLRFFLFDPAPVWGRVTVPVFAIWGGADDLVPPEESRDIIETALRQAGNADVSLQVLPGAGHDLDGTSAEDLMIAWVRAHAAAFGNAWPQWSPELSMRASGVFVSGGGEK